MDAQDLLRIATASENDRLGLRLSYDYRPGAAKPHTISQKEPAAWFPFGEKSFRSAEEAVAYVTGLKIGYVCCEIKRELKNL